MIIGYARVSTDGQTLDVQVAALNAAGANEIFKEEDQRIARGGMAASDPKRIRVVLFASRSLAVTESV